MKLSRHLMLTFLAFTGCAQQQPPEPKARTTTSSATTEVPADDKPEQPTALGPIKLGGGGSSNSTAANKTGLSPEKKIEAFRQAFRPIHVVLVGQWHGIAQKSTGGNKGYEELSWAWDYLTDKAQPALKMTTDANPHFKSARLTYLPDEQQFQMTIEDKQDPRRELRGQFSAEPEDKPGDDNKPQRTYKLLLTETGEAKDRWQVTLNQQENNRYLLEMSNMRGSRFVRFDTISAQREGTSFALNDSDYKEKTCVISQGLGTIQVSHKGKSYWVCCSGCKAAFEEDPEKWITRFEAMQVK